MRVRSVVAMLKSTDRLPPGAGSNAGANVDTNAGANAGTNVGATSDVGSGPSATGDRLLAADEPPPVIEIGLQGRSNFVIVVDHASRRIPRRLNDLGLPASELQRHIAWDIGALGVARQVAAALDAPLVAQNYSRLVIDCNRDPKVPTSIPRLSEASEIPGNLDLSDADRALRRREIFDPYHDRIRALLDARAAAGRPTILVAQHSMTNIYHGVRREMHAAVLYNRDRRFAGLVLDGLRREAGLIVADNQPYFVSDETDYTIPRHGEARGLPHVEIEIRQDLVADAAGQAGWARRIARALQDAEQVFSGAPP
jgi:predicted N-formylglutamate amidohydrolase